MRRSKNQEKREVRVTLAARLPTSVHEELCNVAKRERLSINQILVRACERFFRQSQSEESQVVRDLTEACKVLSDEHVRPELKQALVERLNDRYNLDLDFLQLALNQPMQKETLVPSRSAE